MARKTRCRNLSLTFPLLFTTADAVAIETFARRATSRRVYKAASSSRSARSKSSRAFQSPSRIRHEQERNQECFIVSISALSRNLSFTKDESKQVLYNSIRRNRL